MPGVLKVSVRALALSASALMLGACGGSGVRAGVVVHVTVKTHRVGPHEESGSFTLYCRPTSGTLPFAARICRDIARHPQPMLDPLPARTVCLGGLDMAEVSVKARWDGKSSSFTDSPDCTWPGGVGAAVYLDAATRQPGYLTSAEARLRCEDDPTLLVQPPPFISVEACRHNLWTPRTARLIRIAERAPLIQSLGGFRLFPTEIGARTCTIPAGGPAGTKPFAGTCEVNATRVWSAPTVTFTESWRIGSRRLHSTARVTVVDGRVASVALRGVDPPQLWS